jgi:hypothetical protein
MPDNVSIVEATLGASQASRSVSELMRSTRLPRAAVQAAIVQIATRRPVWRDGQQALADQITNGSPDEMVLPTRRHAAKHLRTVQ